jgi:heme/copper-type cytochrome/quinol oxidase subunit 2
MAFYDFPFLLSEKSESTMYMWFDWFAKWRWMEVQPVITGKYTTIGAPAVRKYFDYNVDQNNPLIDSDLYTTRISRARHNYLPNWVYTPYLYGKNQLWNKAYFDSDVFYTTKSYNNLMDTRIVCEKSYWLWQDLFIEPNFSTQFTPSISGDSIHQKSTWRPFTGIQSYYHTNALLVDLLTKREFVYRNYFEKNLRVIALPKSFTTYPQHPLIKELKASFQFIDPITYGSSYSRETYYNSLSYFKFLLLKNWLLNLNTLKNSPQLAGKYLPINVKFVNDYFFYYFFGSKSQSKVGNNNELYKNQFRPMKKGITTMLRLHGTGAVAMPIEMRLRILASSRDIIHSWSVPSAGIKIDCIPGYTSHRIMTFMSPGIYWGQCQEICGRYHHWMPIICYFMKRDLFFLWCTHFVFKESSRELNNASPRQFNDYIRFASYDKSSWLSEMSTK